MRQGADNFGPMQQQLQLSEAAFVANDGYRLAELYDLDGNFARNLAKSCKRDTESKVRETVSTLENGTLMKDTGWNEVVVNFTWASVLLHERNDYVGAFSFFNSATVHLQKLFSAFDRSYLPLLYVMNRRLRQLALKADEQADKAASHASLEEAARTLNKSFTLCVTDRSAIQESRKWGVYYMINLLMPTYARLNTRSLCKNLVRAASVGEMPKFEQFPLSERILFQYYTGVNALWDEQYAEAEERLSFAIEHCHFKQTHNRELLLEYLIPLRLATKGQVYLPISRNSRRAGSEAILSRIRDLYGPFMKALSKTSLKAFDDALQNAKAILFAKGVYLLMESVRWFCLRDCIRKLWLVSDKNTRLSLDHCQLSLNLSASSLQAKAVAKNRDASESQAASEISREQVECIIANLIDRGLIKGYLSHERGYLVVSQQNPFPPLSTARVM